VGDHVAVELDGEGGGSIEEVLPRRNRLARATAGEGTQEQVLVANLDLLVVVVTMREPAWRAALVDRMLAGAEREGVAARLVFNKVDCELPHETTESESWCRFYREIGYPCLRTSAASGAGIDELRDCLAGHISVFCGLSGVGKSSLLNSIEPGLALRVGLVSTHGAREGRHTTTHSSLLRLRNGGHVIDTPGIRNFGLFGLAPAEAAPLFVEMRSLLGHCSFDDCRHTHEPGCRIKEAVADGRIRASRYDAYVDLLRDAQRGKL